MNGAAERRVAVQRPPIPWFLRWPSLLVAALIALAWRGAGGDLSALVAADARATISDFAAGFFPPKLDLEFLSLVWRPLLETVAIALLGTTLALLLATPLSLLAMRPGLLDPDERPSRLRRFAHGVTRTGLNLMRSIPELIWALLFVRALGIGAAPGVLAIGIGYAGVMGKVFAEIFESTPTAAARSLTGSGASVPRAFAFGMVPQALPMIVSYALYRFDCALRASAILGLVGAGGIGQQIEFSLKMFEYDEVATWLIALFALVALVDLLSVRLRRRLGTDLDVFPTSRRALVRRLVILVGWGAAAVVAARFLEIRPSEVLSGDALGSMSDFVAGMFPPSVEPPFLAGLLPAAAETLSVSVLGTAIASLFGFALAVLGARVRGEIDDVADVSAGSLRRLLDRAVQQGVRIVLNLTRTLPEVVWALVLIFAVGLGPFAGALALGIHTAGVLGRLFLEAFEEVPAAAGAALRLQGAAPWRARWFAALPQALPQLIAYVLYRWEVNIRASAVLGVVGAGGLGTQLYVALSLFQYDRVCTLIATIVALVTAVDLLSGWLRTKLLDADGPGAPSFHNRPVAVLQLAGAPAFQKESSS